jgi:hypothetical protein
MFLNAINQDCMEFQEDCQFQDAMKRAQRYAFISCIFETDVKLLQDLQFLSQLKHGIYDDGCDIDKIQPETLNQYYTDTNHLLKSRTGSRHITKESHSEMASGECKVDAGEELFLGISNDQQCHV